MWLTLTTTTNNNKFISTLYRRLKEFTKNIIIKNNTNYTQEPIAIEYVKAFMLLTKTLQDVCRTSMNRPNRLALHQLTISKYMEQPSF